MPLEQYLEVVPEHFARWRLEDCWKAVHVAKVIRCNWKVAQEAFMESYHVIATHPQILSIIADANSQYDIYGEHVNRNLAAFGAPSPHLGSGRRGSAADARRHAAADGAQAGRSWAPSRRRTHAGRARCSAT